MSVEQNSSSCKESKITLDSTIYEVQEFLERDTRKRRSRKDQNKRDFICEFCKKGYLSKCALNSHIYKHHSNINNFLNIPKNPKGRPKKLSEEIELKDKFIYDKFFECYPIRSIFNNKLTKEDINLCIDNSFRTVFTDNKIIKSLQMKTNYTSFAENKLLFSLFNYFNMKNEGKNEKKTEIFNSISEEITVFLNKILLELLCDL